MHQKNKSVAELEVGISSVLLLTDLVNCHELQFFPTFIQPIQYHTQTLQH